MSSFLVDTDWCIEVLRDNATATQVLIDLRPQGLAICPVTYAELYQGVWYGRDPDRAMQRLHALLRDLTMLSLDLNVMERFAVIRGGMPRNHRQQVGDMDLFIAATAIEHDLALITYNVRDFRLVPSLRLYQPEPA